MRSAALLLASLLAATGHAATAYVSDDLVLGVYADQNSQATRLTTLHSGAAVETLSVSGEFTQVRLADGTTGWVKSSFLVAHEPAAARVKELEDELSRTRAAPAELAEAAAHSEVEQLKGQLAAVQSELDSARVASSSDPASLPRPGVGQFLQTRWPLCLSAAAAMLALGFGLGYAAMARRVRRKFGGIRVY